MITRAVTTLAVSDMEASLEFYAGILGFPITGHFDEGLVFVEAPGMLIALRPRNGTAAVAGPSHIHLGLAVPDVAAAREQLESRGIVFLGETINAHVATVAFFNDPDGTSLYLCELADWIEPAA